MQAEGTGDLQGQLAGHSGIAGQAAAFGHTFTWALSTALAVLPALLLSRLPHKPAQPAPDAPDAPDQKRGGSAPGTMTQQP
ncbi:hypothetical protein [Streptomyces sp. NPDC020951]|uniref:hypothetical protein n=1 Tax=Streptomyces sp. NPDC020951 TaxID=3365104 RepID=UPI0037895339